MRQEVIDLVKIIENKEVNELPQLTLKDDIELTEEEILALIEVGYDLCPPDAIDELPELSPDDPDLELEEIHRRDDLTLNEKTGENPAIAPRWGNISGGNTPNTSWFPHTHWVVSIQSSLNVRSGAGTNYSVVGSLSGGLMDECVGRRVNHNQSSQWFQRVTSHGGFMNEFTMNTQNGAFSFNSRLTRRIGQVRVRVNTNNTNIRQWPGSNPGVPIVGTASSGTIFTAEFDTEMTGIWGNNGIWVRVGSRRWIHSSLLTVI
ncbi:MAG: hypothetical protein FWF59_11645 [Turicibacter sp.]|nr:hypothetical protein [Turicibacter sp.]